MFGIGTRVFYIIVESKHAFYKIIAANVIERMEMAALMCFDLHTPSGGGHLAARISNCSDRRARRADSDASARQRLGT